MNSLYHANETQYLVFRAKEKEDKRNFWFTLFFFNTLKDLRSFFLLSLKCGYFLWDHLNYCGGNDTFTWSLIFRYISLWKRALNMLESTPLCQISWLLWCLLFFIHKQCLQCFMKTYFFGNSFCSLCVQFTET